jgi:RNA polymerase sigma factor (sigma-70 family)
MVSNAEDRKDVIQDVYFNAFKNLKSFAFKAKMSTWIGQITYNACINYLEKKKLVLPGDLNREVEANEEETIMSKKELTTILASEIEKLPMLYKTLIVLYHTEDLSYKDIAQITGLPEGTVKNYLFRARRMLKATILARYKKDEL